jgi:hypothetical protein
MGERAPLFTFFKARCSVAEFFARFGGVATSVQLQGFMMRLDESLPVYLDWSHTFALLPPGMSEIEFLTYPIPFK